ncbi:MAG TPA: four helix bundle protein [Terriglobia bacterium]|nr:four helix bundle protein [Terriglobia bacterium]
MTRAGFNADDLEKRLIAFGANIINLTTSLPRTPQGQHIGRQILRSGTATAANYGEARGAESRSDFVHKLAVVQKELNETAIWLQMIEKSSYLPPEKIVALLAENRELSRIITASLRTAKGLNKAQVSDSH